MRNAPIKRNVESIRAWLNKPRKEIARKPFGVGLSTLGPSGFGRGGEIKRKGGLPERRPKPLPKRNEKRRASEFARCFHSKARVAFVKALPCCVCGRQPTEDYPSQNAHTVIGGTGYKADYDTICPLCFLCHPEQEARTAAFERDRGLPAGFLATCAAETEAKWQAHTTR